MVNCNILDCNFATNLQSRMAKHFSESHPEQPGLVPTSICSKLESMRNKFFIGGDTGEKKMTWVSWNKCLASKKLGGLGIGSIFALNADSRHSSNQGTWCGILSMVNSLKSKGNDLLSLRTRKLGNRSSIRFWDDAWCGNRPLKVLFPRVYLLDIDKGCQVVNRISSNDWNSFLRRPARGGIEAAQLSSLQNLIKDVLSDCCDTWSWSPHSSKGFTVASVWHMIDARFLDVSPTATRWIRDIPIKINVFLWRLSLNKLPSRMNLDKKGIDVDSILCPVCNDDVETVNHLFFSCDMAKDLWSWRDGGSLIFLFV
ncbi:RNA-directed DNA polymerase, eukaryota, reverse transcriptase zinc-binding domain protein [Tanacetum coccineum]